MHNALEISPSYILAVKKQKLPVIWMAHDFWILCGMRSFINPYNAKENKLCEKVEFIKCLRCEGFKSYLRLMFLRAILNKADIGIAPGYFIQRIVGVSFGLSGAFWSYLGSRVGFGMSCCEEWLNM